MKHEDLGNNIWKVTDPSGRTLILVGTAHVGQGSIDAVALAIETHKPDSICVELDSDRLRTLENPSPFESLDIMKIIRTGKTFLFAGHLMLAAYQKKIASETGTKPGDEMRKAVALARERDIPLHLVDRHVQTTLRRLWNKAGLWGQVKLLSALLGGFGEEAKAGDIEKLKEKDALEAMLDEMGAQLPVAKSVLIDERDQYLATRIGESMGQTTVAVVGAGHLKGILERFQSAVPKQPLAPLDEIPKGHLFWKILGWSIPALVVAGIVIGLTTGRGHITPGHVYLWLACNMGGAALGTAIALGHPLSILAAFLGAPIATLSPFLGVGMISGFVEAWVRKPRVADFTTVQDAASTFRGWYGNRVTRILLVFIISSLGGMLGNVAVLPLLLKVIKG